MTKTVKTIVEEALRTQRARALWTANYYPALPITPQVFEIGALLPAMLYMARFGHRRGRGRFVETFGKQRDGTTTAPTIATVADGLRSRPASNMDGFDDGLGGTVLGDLLLTWCLEDRKHAEGHSEQVQRLYPPVPHCPGDLRAVLAPHCTRLPSSASAPPAALGPGVPWLRHAHTRRSTRESKSDLMCNITIERVKLQRGRGLGFRYQSIALPSVITHREVGCEGCP